jgi:hypothetical protein
MSAEQIKQRILELTPDVKPSSLKTFVSNLFNLYKNNEGSGDLEWFLETDKILNIIADRPLSSQKNIVASILRIFPEEQIYRDTMYQLGEQIKETLATNQKTEKQEAGWKSPEELKTIYDDLLKKAKPILNSKTPLEGRALAEVSDFVLFAISSGLFMPPRRSTDIMELKIRDYDVNTDNYIHRGYFVFNKYKTADVYGKTKLAIPKGLKPILSKYIKLNPHTHLLVNNSGAPLTQPRITQKLNDIIGSKTSTSMLRHIYLSSVYKDTPALEDLNQIAKDMGHSVATAMEYAKK